MTYSTGMRSAVCVAAITVAGAAQADVTAEQVWEDWKAQLELYGEDSVSIGAEETSSGVVNVRDVQINYADEEVTINIPLGDFSFNEQADGSVRVTMGDSFPILITGADGVEFSALATQSNLEMVVSGDPESMDYAVTADSYAFTFDEIVDGDMTLTGDARIALNAIDLAYNTSGDEMRTVVTDGTIGSIDLLVDFQIPGGNGEYVTAAGKIGEMVLDTQTTLPRDMDFSDPDALAGQDFSFAGGYTIESAEYVFDINAEGDQMSGSVTAGQAQLSGEFSTQTIGYSAQTNDLAMNIQSSDFPMPIEVSLGQYGLEFLMPVGATDEPADFAIGFGLVDLEISEMLWSLFDPGNVLPRDPATIQIALTGQAKPLFDLLDPAQQEAINASDLPFELENVTLETLRIALAGALVTGEGSFVFDNTDTQTFAPMPRPEGSAVVEINGLNALLDNLVAMGLVPEDQVMGPRMMMGMFARSTGDDQMEIEVEVDAAGQVNVNGNRVR